MADRPTGIVTFLFTDIEGSTTRWEHHREAMQHAVARHDSVMRQAITSHAGHVFKTVGDAFYSTFDSPLDAIEAACDAQCALLNEDWGDLPAVRVRMAVHTGPAESRDHDYFGPSLNRVARLLAAGHSGSRPTLPCLRSEPFLLNGNEPYGLTWVEMSGRAP